MRNSLTTAAVFTESVYKLRHQTRSLSDTVRGRHEEEELGDELARRCKGSAIMPARPERAAVISASAVIPVYTPRVGVCCVPGSLLSLSSTALLLAREN